jgi:nucleotide-binding universal stress UspA family protein
MPATCPPQEVKMTNAILVPLDGSPTSRGAVPLAMAVGSAIGASVELVHVHELAPLFGSAPALDTALDVDDARRMREPIAALADRLTRDHHVSVTGTLLIGAVAPTIEQHVVDRGVRLVVMSTHGRGGLARAWLGSVADRLIRARIAPVLLVRPEAEQPQGRTWPPTRVLVPLDSTTMSEDVLPPLMTLLASNGTELVLLTVVEPLPPLEPFPDVAIWVDRSGTQAEQIAANGARAEEAADNLERIAQRLREKGTQVRTHVVVHPSAARGVLEYADETGVDLIALATHARGAVARAIMGSVADKVMRGASVPVLVVPPRGT